MKTDWFLMAIGLMWVALPLTLRMYWEAWDSLPARMAVHFDLQFRPNGYASKQVATAFGIGMLTFILATFTFTGLMVENAKKDGIWLFVAIAYAIVTLMTWVNWFIIKSNLDS